MGKSKKSNRKKGTMIRTIKSKSNDSETVNSSQQYQIPPALKPLVAGMQQEQERRVRFAEMKGIRQHQKVISMLDEIKANQIVLQTLLLENNTINKEAFVKEYQRYVTEVVGIVKDGQMDGMVLIDTFNIGVTPKPNSIDDIKNKSKSPLLINRG